MYSSDIWDKIFDCWHLKLWAGLISCLTFLVGDITAAPFIALWVLVIIDTLTRWMALGRKALENHGESGSAWKGIVLAFLDRSINSNALRGRFQTKCMAYLILLIGFNLLDQIIPDRVFGQNIEGMPNAFISTWLAFVELQSIIENLIELGMESLQPLKGWVCRRKDTMTSGPQTGPPREGPKNENPKL